MAHALYVMIVEQHRVVPKKRGETDGFSVSPFQGWALAQFLFRTIYQE
jgi:hypothetical protein